jgi:hypothetical protein
MKKHNLLKPSIVEIGSYLKLRPADIPRQEAACSTDYFEAFEVKPGGKLS